jgi:hypothetical protein
MVAGPPSTMHQSTHGTPNAVVRSAPACRRLRGRGAKRNVMEARGCFFRALGWGGSSLFRKASFGRHRRRGKGLPTSEAGLRLVDGQLCRLPEPTPERPVGAALPPAKQHDVGAVAARDQSSGGVQEWLAAHGEHGPVGQLDPVPATAVSRFPINIELEARAAW